MSCARLKAGIYRYAYAEETRAFATESPNVRTYDQAVDDGTFSRERDNEVPGVITRCYAGGDHGEGAPPDCRIDQSTDPGFKPIPAP